MSKCRANYKRPSQSKQSQSSTLRSKQNLMNLLRCYSLQRVVLNLQTVLEKYNETVVQERTRGCLISIMSFYPELARELGAREIFPTHKFPPMVQPIVSKKW